MMSLMNLLDKLQAHQYVRDQATQSDVNPGLFYLVDFINIETK